MALGVVMPTRGAAPAKEHCLPVPDRELVVGEYAPHPHRKPPAVLGQRNVRGPGMLATETPRREPKDT